MPRRHAIKWFKHMTDMSADVKVKRLIRKHGVQGYGLYCYILELIVRKLETESPLPCLEESAQDIAGDLVMDTVKVEEIMHYAIDQGLLEFDQITGRIVAHKIYKYLQQSETRSQEIRSMISAYKGGRLSLSQTVTDKCEEQNRTEQKRIEGYATHPSLNVPINQARYDKLVVEYGQAIVDNAIQERLDWESANGKTPAKDYAAAAANWLKKAEEFGNLPEPNDGLKPHKATR